MKERIKLILKEWFEFKTGIELSDDTLTKLVNDIIGVQLSAERFDAEEFLNNKDIFHHPRITTRLNDDSFEVADLMAEFANSRYES